VQCAKGFVIYFTTLWPFCDLKSCQVGILRCIVLGNGFFCEQYAGLNTITIPVAHEVYQGDISQNLNVLVRALLIVQRG
jgi:hypothetical protein